MNFYPGNASPLKASRAEELIDQQAQPLPVGSQQHSLEARRSNAGLVDDRDTGLIARYIVF